MPKINWRNAERKMQRLEDAGKIIEVYNRLPFNGGDEEVAIHEDLDIQETTFRFGNGDFFRIKTSELERISLEIAEDQYTVLLSPKKEIEICQYCGTMFKINDTYCSKCGGPK